VDLGRTKIIVIKNEFSNNFYNMKFSNAVALVVQDKKHSKKWRRKVLGLIRCLCM
jgi:hypothetical protein